MTPPSERAELRCLTALRGVAAIAVVAQHFSATAQQNAAEKIPSLVPHGYVAVDFFFVLSGFVLCYVYRDTFGADGMRAYLPFLGKRIARLLPLNAFVIALMAAADAISVHVSGHNLVFGLSDPHIVRDLLANAVMLQGFGFVQNLNGPTWSVSTELVAYAAFPALLLLIFRDRFRAILAVFACAAGITALAVASGPGLGLTAEAPPLSFVHCITEFVIGMAAYRLYTVPAISRLLGRDGVTAGLVAVALVCALARYDLLTVATFPLLTIAFAANAGWPARLVQIPPLYGLGVISYSVYLLHDGFRGPEIVLMHGLYPGPLREAPALVFAAVGTLSIIPFACLTYRWIERPGRGAMRRMFAHVGAAQAWTIRRAMR